MKNIAICPGSFDPITKAHIDIIKKATKLFKNIIVLVCDNSNKNHIISKKDRILLVKSAIAEANISNVKVDYISDQLTIDYCKTNQINIIVRGIRYNSDLEKEMSLAHANQLLAKDIQTVILLSAANTNHISSSLIKEIAINHGSIKEFVPKCVYEYFRKLYDK